MLTSAKGTGGEVKLRHPRIFFGVGSEGSGLSAITTRANTRIDSVEP
jgi:hypothetical protein